MIKKTAYPTIIQGGMGVGVSDWPVDWIGASQDLLNRLHTL